MQDKVVKIVFFVLFFGSAFAFDAKVDSIQAPIVLYGQQADFNILITPDGSPGTMNFIDNGTIIEQKTYPATQSIITFSKTWTILGQRTIGFSISDFNQTDLNATNNTKSLDINVLKDVDFKIVSQVVPQVYTPNVYSNYFVEIENLGQRNFVGTGKVGMYIDSNLLMQKNFTDLNILRSVGIDFNYLIPSDFNGSHPIIFQVNFDNTIREYDYTNNSYSTIISQVSKANLLIESLTYSGEIKKGIMKTFNALVKNDGGLTASNIVFRIYNDTILLDNKVFETTIPYIEAHTSKAITFSYIPTRGDINQTLIAYIDPLNTVEEFNENDNVSQITFYVLDSNQAFDQATYVYVLENLQGEIQSCRNSVYSIQLEKENALSSLSNKTKELDSCTSDLLTCNSHNATFLSNWTSNRDENFSQIISALEQTYSVELSAKRDDLEMSKLKCVEEKNVLQNDTKREVSNKEFFFGTTLFLIVLIISNVLIGNFVKPKGKILN